MAQFFRAQGLRTAQFQELGSSQTSPAKKTRPFSELSAPKKNLGYVWSLATRVVWLAECVLGIENANIAECASNNRQNTVQRNNRTKIGIYGCTRSSIHCQILNKSCQPNLYFRFAWFSNFCKCQPKNGKPPCVWFPATNELICNTDLLNKNCQLFFLSQFVRLFISYHALCLYLYSGAYRAWCEGGGSGATHPPRTHLLFSKMVGKFI